MMTPRAGLVGFAGDRRVLIGGPLDRVDDHDGDVRLLDRAARDDHRHPLDLPGPRDSPRPPDPGGIEDPERALLPFEDGVHRIPRRPRHVADDGAFLFQQPIEQRRLPDIRPADDGNPRLDVLDGSRPLARAFGKARRRSRPADPRRPGRAPPQSRRSARSRGCRTRRAAPSTGGRRSC